LQTPTWSPRSCRHRARGASAAVAARADLLSSPPSFGA
jgi:hypothetical protein